MQAHFHCISWELHVGLIVSAKARQRPAAVRQRTRIIITAYPLAICSSPQAIAMNDTPDLAAIPLFRGLDHDQLADVSGLLRRAVYPAGMAMIAAEHPGQEIYLIVEGTVKVFIDQVDGTTVTLAILGPGAIVGEMGVVQHARRSANVVTLERSSVRWMYRDDFEACLKRIPQIGLNLAAILAQRLSLANERLLSFATEDVDRRIARVLHAFALDFGRPLPDGGTVIPLRLTQSDLADLVGAARISVNKTITALKDSHLISIDRRYQIVIHHLAELERMRW